MLTQHARRGKDFSSTTQKEKKQYAGRLVRSKERTAIDLSLVPLAPKSPVGKTAFRVRPNRTIQVPGRTQQERQ